MMLDDENQAAANRGFSLQQLVGNVEDYRRHERCSIDEAIFGICEGHELDAESEKRLRAFYQFHPRD